jgi:putative phosphoesterase
MDNAMEPIISHIEITLARVGIISDTHGLLRPEALAFLKGCDHIVHGGDIGNVEILSKLSSIAPVTAVRGNNDKGAWAEALPETELFEIHGTYIYAIHDLALLDIEPSAAGVQAVISGHSHKPGVEHRDGVIYVNPGSAGPRRFRLPVAVAELTIIGGSVSARIVELEVSRQTCVQRRN